MAFRHVIARIWSLLTWWIFVRLGKYFRRSSPHYHQATAANSLRQLSAQTERIDPFSLVADELSTIAERLRALDIVEVPKLASAVQYYFKPDAKGKMFRPTILLLMATALRASNPKSRHRSLGDTELRRRQQLLAEITEMVHVASLVHDDILDDADTRRGIESLNSVMGNKLAVLASDFLLSRASTALASLKSIEVVSLIATTMENLLIDDVLDFTGTSESLGKGSLSDIRHGIVTAPILYAIEEYPQLREVVEGGLDDPAAVNLALEYIRKSGGIQKAKDLAKKHADLAAEAIYALPDIDDDDVIRSRLALIELTNMVVTRTK